MLTKKQKFDWALQFAIENKLRKTKALQKIIEFFAEQKHPVTWNGICDSEEVGKHFDPATIYRLLTRMEKIGLIRKLGFRSRSTYYTLALPGKHHDYLICMDCGDISDLGLHINNCPLTELETHIMNRSGFKHLYHELEFYGKCPNCQDPSNN